MGSVKLLMKERKVPNKGYNYEFRLLLEGVQCPFYNAVIQCTPNGVEANINVHAVREAIELKPKTAVQIFYRDFVDTRNWRLCFDGFFSSFARGDEAAAGRSVGLVCRDFRMDIRKSPAALAWIGESDLTVQNYYTRAGLLQKWIVHGKTKPNASGQSGEKGTAIELYGNDGLTDFAVTLMLIAGTASGSRNGVEENVGGAAIGNKTTDQEYYDKFGKKKPKAKISQTPSGTTQTTTATSNGDNVKSTNVDNAGVSSNSSWNDFRNGNAAGAQSNTQNQQSANNVKSASQDQKQNQPSSVKFEVSNSYNQLDDIADKGEASMMGINGGFFLDAIIRGLWTEAIGGAAVGEFFHKRVRADKRIITVKNRSGYNMFRRNNFGIEVGSYMMGESRFTSIEAAIMRVAGMFLVRPYSCSTPSFIDVNAYDESVGAAHHIVDQKVWNYLIETNQEEFGQKYILNETMLLPPLEFTAPPTCNLIFPPMYHRINYQYDYDVDITRGYFDEVDSWSVPGAQDLGKLIIQVPNALFNMLKTEGKEIDQYGRRKTPLTLEERYKGVNVLYSNVEWNLAGDDACGRFLSRNFKDSVIKKIRAEIDKLKKDINDIQETIGISVDKAIEGIPESQKPEIKKQLQKELDKIYDPKSDSLKRLAASTESAMQRHALIKFLNSKYQGRVVAVDMTFNPYIMCGFPGAIISDADAYGDRASKTILGMVQQSKHFIAITSNGGEASTSVVLNNTRMVDEPTDMDPYGMPLYMKATDPTASKINPLTLQFDNKDYEIPQPMATVEKDFDSVWYDLHDRIKTSTYIYAKDFLTLTARQQAKGQRNTSYLDIQYEPNKVSNFYRDVFGQRNHFMVGTTEVDGETVYYMYDTIHEAIENLKNRPELLHDFEACMRYVHRDVCTADQFYHGIMGATSYDRVLDDDENEVWEYVNHEWPFEGDRLDDEYFGISDELWNSGKLYIEGLKSSFDLAAPGASMDSNNSYKGMMQGPGELSSILEHIPVTAMIKERKDAVKKYIVSAKEFAQTASIRE